MDKNKFFLIIILGVVILVFLFKNYQNTKEETLNDYQNYQSLQKKIKEIKYLQNLYTKKPYIRECNIKETDKYIISCNNLTNKQFKTISNAIFNRHYNISKFKITQNSIYVEILK